MRNCVTTTLQQCKRVRFAHHQRLRLDVEGRQLFLLYRADCAILLQVDQHIHQWATLGRRDTERNCA